MNVQASKLMVTGITKMGSLKNITLAAALVCSAGLAQAAVVSFDENFGGALTEGTEITTFDFGAGLTGSLTVTGGTAEARVLDSESGNGLGVTNDPDLASPFSDADRVLADRGFGNVLIVQSDDAGVSIPNDERSGGSITFTFDTAIILDSIFLLDGEEGISLTYGLTTLSGLGGADNTFDFVTANSGPILSFTVEFGGSGAIGEFKASVVPLPAGLPLLIGGLGAFAWMKRRKQA
ncbi:hypothetical protein RLO149_c020010 [Roseobacter litoralis Och 149]|uniref:VPLPA-CTERM protein sorting domain-containing protein n=2 Tax=Roseobacter litoralis TaxID=42443 RepID=F7ZKX4_ROSLO|nr:hypothetical protein RLO149_c020010 [Roseobacter litoralis Och 149]